MAYHRLDNAAISCAMGAPVLYPHHGPYGCEKVACTIESAGAAGGTVKTPETAVGMCLVLVSLFYEKGVYSIMSQVQRSDSGM